MFSGGLFQILACFKSKPACMDPLQWIDVSNTQRLIEAEMDDQVDSSYRVTADELRQFVERYERLEIEKKDIADQQKEIMAEAKGRGYDTKVLRKIVALRKRDMNDIAEEEAVLAVYKEALGMH
jgi:uncharacterized protein (UPF0335 family)